MENRLSNSWFIKQMYMSDIVKLRIGSGTKPTLSNCVKAVVRNIRNVDHLLSSYNYKIKYENN